LRQDQRQVFHCRTRGAPPVRLPRWLTAAQPRHHHRQQNVV